MFAWKGDPKRHKASTHILLAHKHRPCTRPRKAPSGEKGEIYTYLSRKKLTNLGLNKRFSTFELPQINEWKCKISFKLVLFSPVSSSLYRKQTTKVGFFFCIRFQRTQSPFFLGQSVRETTFHADTYKSNPPRDAFYIRTH